MERSYVLMEHYGKDVEAEREYISGLDSAKNLLIVAATGEEVVGCLAALQADGGRRPETTHILHVGLHLREAYRGLGIGRYLLDYAINWAVEKGFKKLEANIFTTNKHSLGLFTKAGFAEEGVRKNRIQVGRELINEVLMGKLL
jgi:L-amino acid N-acyltransferase YncA